MANIKPIPIGTEFYKEMIDGEFYYIDKTLLIRDLLEQKNNVVLFTRPRRFGKTLAQTMLKVYFEKEYDKQGNVINNEKYFKNKKIMQAGEKYIRHMGKYPVIFLSLKCAKQPTLEMAYESLKDQIMKEYDRHNYILKDNVLSAYMKEKFEVILTGKAGKAVIAASLQFLSECLAMYHQTRCIILIDEYDVPLENAYLQGFYDEMVDFIRSLLESALKTNESLERAVITGCLRISKESIFTGLNNFEVVSLLSKNYSEYFGFIQSEVNEMFEFYGIGDKLAEAGEWYDGYLFGDTEVYNPWSIINYVKAHVYGGERYPKPYWSNTSSNSIVRELIESADVEQKLELEKLLAGETIEKPVHEDITYADIHESEDNLWNFLFFTGYLKKASEKFEGDQIYLAMKIPNKEITYIYRNFICDWFANRTKREDHSVLYDALLSGDAKTAENILSDQLMESISYFDYDESFYHGFMAGLLKGCKNYLVLSNRESGTGRPDIIWKYASVRGKAVVMEFKQVSDYADMDKGIMKALQQISDNRYEVELQMEGYKNILMYGVCFCKKECRVQLFADKMR